MKGKHHSMKPTTDIGTQISSDVQIVQRLSLSMQIVAAFIMVGSLVGAIGIGLNFIVVPGSDVLQQGGATITVGSGQPFYLSAWYPFQACYAGSCGGFPYQLLPQGWPASTTDSDRIVGIGVNTVVAGESYLGQQYSSTPPYQPIVDILNWGQATGIKVDLDDLTLWGYIKGDNPWLLSQIDDHIQGLVRNYGSHPGLGGWYLGNEPEGWGSTLVEKEGMYARLGDVVARFKAADPNHRVYTTTATASKLRFCREGQLSLMLNTGFSYLRNGTIADDSAAFQSQVDRSIFNFDEDYLCTRNYAIPVAYSVAANYWAGDTITPAETNMFAYLSLAHGIQGIEWFPYSTTGGLVWDNQAPVYTLNFQNWLPAMQGGRIYLDSTYISGTSGGNARLQVDNVTKHSGNSAAKINVTGTVTNYYNLRLNPPENANAPWNPKFPNLKEKTQYTVSGWVKISGTANVQIKATGPGFYSFSPTLSNTADWTQLVTTFTTPASLDPDTVTVGPWTFGPYVNSTGSGSVWFDDFSLVEVGDPAQRNIAEDYNPGFETVTGADRTPHEPLYSAVRQANTDFATLGPIFSPLTKINTFNDQSVPNAGLVTGLSSVVSQGLPRVEVGMFTSAPVGGDYYLVVVNRNISSSATISLALNAPNAIALDDLLAGTSQQFASNGTQVAATVTLAPGAGKAFHVSGVTYNEPVVGTPIYSEDFEDGQMQGWSTLGGTWSIVDDGAGKVLDVTAGTDARGIATTVNAGNFEYSGRFKIMPDHDPINSLLWFTFRKDSANPDIEGTQYNYRIKLDPGAEDSSGYVQLVRTSQNSAVICQVADENFLRGDRYINFVIRGVGNTFEASFDGVTYLTCVDPSSEALASGQIGFRLLPGGHVRLDDLAVSSLSQTDSGCTESWTCGDWSACSNSSQTRTCTDANACGTTTTQPALAQSCTDTNTNVNSNSNANTNTNTNAPPACTERWSCTAWSTCTNDQQSRTCTDTNSCGTIVNKPLLTQSCSTTPPPPPSTCLTDWQCGAWSACDAQNRQQRHCVEANQCPNTGQASVFDDMRTCNTNTGGPDDLTPPETSAPTVDPTIYSDVAQLALSGSDNVTTPANLRFTYRVDGGQARVAPAGPTLLVRGLSNAQHSVALQAIDEAGNADPTPATISFTVKNVLSIVTAPRGRAPTEVRAFDYLGRLRSRFTAFPGLSTGASVAVLDVEGDGTGEIAVAPGRGGPPEVRIFTAKGKFLRKFNVFPRGFSGGANLAAADLNGDGIDELIAAQASGTGSFVRVFTSKGRLLAETSVLGKKFRGGVAVAAGHISSGGAANIIIAPASNGQPVYAQYRLTNGKLSLVRRVRLPVTAKTVAATLAIENLDNWGDAEIVASVSAAKQPTQFFVLSSAGTRLATITAPNSQRGAVNLSAGDLRGFDNRAEVVTANADAVTTRVNVFTSPNTSIRVSRQVTTFAPYPSRRWAMSVDVGHL